MATELSCFKNGVAAWTIEYDCSDEQKLPAMSGEIPKAAHAILESLREKQRADDGADYIYELTAELGHKLVGFRHDTDVEGDALSRSKFSSGSDEWCAAL